MTRLAVRPYSLFLKQIRSITLGAAIVMGVLQPASAQENFSKEMILNDPEAPVAGNAQGDVTIVAFLDYNCPFCKKNAPDLERIVSEDGNIRLVYKDWPILTEALKYGARAALAAKYQGKYIDAHRALMSIPGRQIQSAEMRDAIAAAGIDMSRLEADLRAHAVEIEAIIDRNLAQAEGLGLQGTPVFLIGSFQVASALSYDDFRKIVGEMRSAPAK